MRSAKTSLARALREFFADYLPRVRGMSPHTVCSYRDEITLLLRFPGYKRQLIQVAADQSTVTAQLEEDVFDLEAVVISGQATTVAQRNLPNAVATVRADELVRAPSQTIETALQGKIPGALIQANSGAPGGGMQINLRGVSTVNGSVDA